MITKNGQVFLISLIESKYDDYGVALQKSWAGTLQYNVSILIYGCWNVIANKQFIPEPVFKLNNEIISIDWKGKLFFYLKNGCHKTNWSRFDSLMISKELQLSTYLNIYFSTCSLDFCKIVTNGLKYTLFDSLEMYKSYQYLSFT